MSSGKESFRFNISPLDQDELSAAAECVEAFHTGDVEMARKHIKHNNPRVRAFAIEALSKYNEITVDDIKREIDSGEVESSIAVVRAGKNLGYTFDEFISRKDLHPLVRESIIFEVGEAKAISHLPVLNELASKDDDPMIREAAVVAIGNIGDPSSLPVILAATRDKTNIRRRAAVALSQYEEEESLERLRKLAVEDRDWQTRQIAQAIIEIEEGD
ncbi:MAG: HEAT repeat domain-containing protein [Actinomycetota bacterium]|nr:HEAT repeat domain-containing protein [Actinomycetota bacterium]